MPGKAAVTVALQPSGDATPAAPQKSCPFVLKKVMDIPPPNILEEGEDGKNALEILHSQLGVNHLQRCLIVDSVELMGRDRSRHAV